MQHQQQAPHTIDCGAAHFRKRPGRSTSPGKFHNEMPQGGGEQLRRGKAAVQACTMLGTKPSALRSFVESSSCGKPSSWGVPTDPRFGLLPADAWTECICFKFKFDLVNVYFLVASPLLVMSQLRVVRNVSAELPLIYPFGLVMHCVRAAASEDNAPQP